MVLQVPDLPSPPSDLTVSPTDSREFHIKLPPGARGAVVGVWQPDKAGAYVLIREGEHFAVQGYIEKEPNKAPGYGAKVEITW